jgi:hypothetical protein
MNKKIVWTITFVIVVILTSIFYIYVPKTKNNGSSIANTQMQNSQQLTTTTSEKINPSMIDTSSWKTYINTKYGFEFKYPENVGIVNEESGRYAGPPTNPQEDLLLITDKEGTFHFQINNGVLYKIKNSLLGDTVLTTLKFKK